MPRKDYVEKNDVHVVKSFGQVMNKAYFTLKLPRTIVYIITN